MPVVGSGGGHEVQLVVARVLTANGVRTIARPYSHEPLPAGVDVAVEYDSSVTGESRYQGITWVPIEVKTRILEGASEWETVVPATLDILKYLGARVNQSTGHHVHLSLPEAEERPRVIRSLTSLVKRIEPVIYGLLAPSRRHSPYCTPLGGRLPDLRECKTLADYENRLRGQSRYYGVNLLHVTSSRPRVEFRHHQGTLDPVKARHWLRFLLQVTEHAVTRNCQSHAEPLPNNRNGFERMATAIGLRVNSKIYREVSPALIDTARYLLRRWKHFNGQPIVAEQPTLTEQAVEREVA